MQMKSRQIGKQYVHKHLTSSAWHTSCLLSLMQLVDCSKAFPVGRSSTVLEIEEFPFLLRVPSDLPSTIINDES